MNLEETLNEYRERFGELNPLYDTCGDCQYEDEFGCWQPRCKRKCKSKFEADLCDDMQRDYGLSWIPINRGEINT